jgi:hypothetical protein
MTADLGQWACSLRRAGLFWHIPFCVPAVREDERNVPIWEVRSESRSTIPHLGRDSQGTLGGSVFVPDGLMGTV